MYADTIEGFAKVAEKKLAALRRAPGGFFVASMLAGAYVDLRGRRLLRVHLRISGRPRARGTGAPAGGR